MSHVFILFFLVSIGQSDPNENLNWLVYFVIGVAFFSATQDICIDALRIEMVEERELGQSAAVYQMGWRVGGVWISQVLGLLIGGIIGYSYAYTYVALIFLALSLFVFFFVQEPKREIRPYISLYDQPLTWIYDSFYLSNLGSLRAL